MARKKTDEGTPVSLADLGIERWTSKQVHRSQLINHPCNPRVISDEERRRLKKLLKRHGLLEGPVWNERSGNLVGGHQRVSICDSLVGHANYTLHVAAVDLDEVQEREALIALNNAEAQGSYDIEKLGELFKPGDIDIDSTGFSPADIVTLYGENVLEQQSEEAIARLADRLRERKQAQEEHLTKLATKRDNPDFYLVLVFKDSDERDLFMARAKLDEGIFQDGRQIARAMNVDLDLDE